MHDEAHDGFEVVSMKCDLRLLGHVDASGVPGPLAVPQPLQPLATIGGLECVYSLGEAGGRGRGCLKLIFLLSFTRERNHAWRGLGSIKILCFL